MRGEVVEWLSGERVNDTRVNSAINDAIEDLWAALILASMSSFMAGPVSLPLPINAERIQLVSVPDPAVGPTYAAPVAGGPYVAQHNPYVVITYVTESGSETNPSPISGSAIAVGFLAQLAAIPFVAGAIGWNLYSWVGGALDPAPTVSTGFAKQNDEPIPFGVPFIEPPNGFVNADGQSVFSPPPTENTTGDNLAYIRHFEFQTSSGMYKTYDRGDIDSSFMRKMASYVSTSSEYQTYAWDLINQRQLEIRPATGQAFTPRYFYVVKPRRLRFDNAALPFPTIPSTEFIRTYALARIFLSLHEYDAATGWETAAEKKRLACMRALSMVNVNLNQSVTPYLY
jgi:hypothetical protein